MAKARGWCIGVGYGASASSQLNGTITDAENMAAYLNSIGISSEVITDTKNPEKTTAVGLINLLGEIATESVRSKLDYVFVTYSGHGSNIRDRNGDEKDKKDECLVPSDFESVGFVSDDCLSAVFRRFYPKTKAVFVFDCCYSGTLGDLLFKWVSRGSAITASVDNIRSRVKTQVLTISGCRDNQVAEEAPFNVKTAGVLTSNLLEILKADKDVSVFGLFHQLTERIKAQKFAQVPVMCSSYNLYDDVRFLPLTIAGANKTEKKKKTKRPAAIIPVDQTTAAKPKRKRAKAVVAAEAAALLDECARASDDYVITGLGDLDDGMAYGPRGIMVHD